MKVVTDLLLKNFNCYGKVGEIYVDKFIYSVFVIHVCSHLCFLLVLHGYYLLAKKIPILLNF